MVLVFARRRTMLIALALVAVAPATATAQAPGCSDTDLAVTAATAARAADAVRCLVNAERTARGLRPLAADQRLTSVARAYADEMRSGDFFDHTAPDGSTPGSRVSDAGYRWSTVGENIAMGQRTPREVMTAWMRSPDHCENVLAPGFTELGVGVVGARRDAVWVQNLARPRGASAPAGPDPAAVCPAAGLTSSAASGGSGGGTGTTTGSAPSGSGAGGSDHPRGARALRVAVSRRGRVLHVAGTVTGVRTVEVAVGRRSRTVSVRDGRFSVRLDGSKGARVTVRAAALLQRLVAR